MGVEDELSEKYIVLSCNGEVFVMNYETYSAFKNSGEPGTVLVDKMGEERTQTFVRREDIQELEMFTSYDEAAEYISSLNKQPKALS